MEVINTPGIEGSTQRRTLALLAPHARGEDEELQVSTPQSFPFRAEPTY